eukprot:scaffold3904_cov19-Prasinocladus_malaysianus.AAC.1
MQILWVVKCHARIRHTVRYISARAKIRRRHLRRMYTKLQKTHLSGKSCDVRSMVSCPAGHRLIVDGTRHEQALPPGSTNCNEEAHMYVRVR